MRASPVALVALALCAGPAWAQMLLQGAVGAPKPAAKASLAVRPRPPGGMQLPREETLLGHDLVQGGAAGRILFKRDAGALKLAHLSLVGEALSKPGEGCQLDVVAADAIALRPAGRPAGLLRYDVAFPACPFSFDVLDGAVLVAANGSCDFVAADCRVSAAGLWGPPARAFDARGAQNLAHALVATEARMRADFRALIARAGKDQGAVKAVAREQAGFSSEREMLCRDYAGEPTHGFCALRATEAKLFDLQARLGTLPLPAFLPARFAPRPRRGAASEARAMPPADASEAPKH